jgi:hypothetical protein
MATYYELLGVNPHASAQEIHDGFAHALHDFQKSLSLPIHADQTKIDLLHSAYETLKDPAARAAYDRSIAMPLPHLSIDAERPRPGEQEPAMAATVKNYGTKLWDMRYAIFKEPATSGPGRENSLTEGGSQRKFISIPDRIAHAVAALAILAYGAFGLRQNDLYIPGRFGPGIHFRGIPAWAMYGAFICAALNLLSVAADHFDASVAERNYHVFAKVTQIAGWTLFIGAILASRSMHS